MWGGGVGGSEDFENVERSWGLEILENFLKMFHSTPGFSYFLT